MSTFYFPWMGGKRTEFKHIDNYLQNNTYDTFVEPFCGSSATSFLNHSKNKIDCKYHLNDTDETLIKLLMDIQKNTSESYFKFCNDSCIDLTKEKYKKIINDYKNDITNTSLFFFFKRVYNIHPGLYPDPNNKRSKLQYSHTQKHIDLDKFYKNAKLTNLDYMDILNQYKNDENAFVYLDPPYLDSCNSSYHNYNTSSNDVMDDKNMIIIDHTLVYIDIIEFLKTCKCKVIMIINKNAINSFIYNDFIIDEYEKKYNTVCIDKYKKYYKKMTKHIIIGANLKKSRQS